MVPFAWSEENSNKFDLERAFKKRRMAEERILAPDRSNYNLTQQGRKTIKYFFSRSGNGIEIPLN
jgi:hypothetical protein